MFLDLVWNDINFTKLLYEVNVVSIFIRIFLAMLAGAVLGIERGMKNRPAGFRTYMVVCIGSTVAMLTNQYIYETMGSSDPTRIAAQVISGIGFLGVGTIIVTGHNQVKGLTTAAGLWAAATLGIAIGCGFYTGAVVGCVALFVTMNCLNFISNYIIKKMKVVALYLELEEFSDIGKILKITREHGYAIIDIETNQLKGNKSSIITVTLTVELNPKQHYSQLLELLGKEDGVDYVEELKEI